MAHLTWKGLDQTFSEMRKTGQTTGQIAQEMIKVGSDECIAAWKATIGARGHVKTGDMMKSVGVKFKKKGGERVAEIYPLGKDRHGVRNAEKAFVLHYGTSKIKGDRFVDEAEAMAEAMAVPAMQEVWAREK